jgi:hypothetical protein
MKIYEQKVMSHVSDRRAMPTVLREDYDAGDR